MACHLIFVPDIFLSLSANFLLFVQIISHKIDAHRLITHSVNYFLLLCLNIPNSCIARKVEKEF